MKDTIMRVLQEQALEIAAKRCGLDAHIVCIERKPELHTWADRIASRFYFRGMPIKRTFLFCETLDMTFFFDQHGSAMYAYAGYADSRDATETKIVNAFKKANHMRLQMEIALKELQKTASIF